MPLTTDGRIFRQHGEAWRWKGVTAFKLLERFRLGEDIDPFLRAFAGYNVLRIFDYVTWPGEGWEPSPIPTVLNFLEHVAPFGFYVELVMLTDDDAGRLDPAKRRVQDLASAAPVNLLPEGGNEPQTHKDIDTPALRSTLEASGFLFSSGDYEQSSRHFGSFLTHHSPRDGEWPRKSHDAKEFWDGGGPHAPTDPAHKIPVVLDEPIRPDQAPNGTQHGWPYAREDDFRAYFGGAGIFAGGATYHFEGGKFGRAPDADEQRFAAIALDALNAFPADAPGGVYTRIDEDESQATQGTLSTYVVGNYMVRVRPKPGTGAPQPGWTALDTDGILWTR